MAESAQSYRQTVEYANFLKRVGWIIETKQVDGRKIFAFIKKLGPVSILKLQRVDVEFLPFDWVKSIQIRHRVVTTYLEEAKSYRTKPQPNPFLIKEGYKVADDFMIPTKSRLIDLTLTEEEILAGFKPKTRYNLKLSHKNNLYTTIWTGLDLQKNEDIWMTYVHLLECNAKRVGMIMMSKNWLKAQLDAFGNNGFIVAVGSKNTKNKLLAATTYLTSNNAVFYTHNGSTHEGRVLMAPTLAIYEGIKEGKRRELKWFDFDGIYDERRPKKRWLGYTRFKSGFGGDEGYFDLMYKQIRWPF